MVSYVTNCLRGSLKNLKDKVHVNTTRVNLGSEEMNEAKVLGRKQQQKNKNKTKSVKTVGVYRRKKQENGKKNKYKLSKDSFDLALSVRWRYNLRGYKFASKLSRNYFKSLARKIARVCFLGLYKDLCK